MKKLKSEVFIRLKPGYTVRLSMSTVKGRLLNVLMEQIKEDEIQL